MISIDTNIIVRFITKDDPSQYKKSYKIFKEEKLFISNTVLQETEWVLRGSYGFKSDEINLILIKLLGLPNVYTSNPLVLKRAIQWHKEGLGFSDALHLSQSQDTDKFLTFDKKLVSKSKKLKSCEVELL